MSELALFLVRTGFLILLWVFIFSIISVIRADLFGQKVASKVAEVAIPAVISTPIIAAETKPAQAPASQLVITGGSLAGQQLALTGRQFTIGRSADSDLIVNDEYASTHHAKLVFINGDWMLQDLDSTNGSYLDGERISTPVVVPQNTQVRIGQTTFELRS